MFSGEEIEVTDDEAEEDEEDLEKSEAEEVSEEEEEEIDDEILKGKLINPIWHEGSTFIPLSFLNWIFSVEFLSILSKLFWRYKLKSFGLIWHPARLIESYKSCQ